MLPKGLAEWRQAAFDYHKDLSLRLLQRVRPRLPVPYETMSAILCLNDGQTISM